MSGASIEATLELWASSLREVKRRMRPLFTQERVARSAEHFLDGLLGEERRKTGWMRAEAVGDPGPWRQQAILGRGSWDADALRDIVRGYALETLAADDVHSRRRRDGLLEAGQGVLWRCAAIHGFGGQDHELPDRRLRLLRHEARARLHRPRALSPKSWTDDKARMAKAHVPQEMIESAQGGFATKPALALAMIKRAIAAKVPFSFVAADTVYGVGDIEMALRRAGKGYVLGVKSNEPFHSWDKPQIIAGMAKEIADRLPASAWARLSAGAGTKGERLHDWAYVELADLEAGQYAKALKGQTWTRGL